MRRTLAILPAALLLAVTPGLVPEAQAGDWFFGGGFSIGGHHFRIGYRPHHYGGDYFYRVSTPVRYSGYSCGPACYREGSHYYHHASCPVVAHHFHHHGYHPQRVFYAYAPYSDGYGFYDHSHGGRHYKPRHYERRYYEPRHYRDSHHPWKKGHHSRSRRGHDSRRHR